MLRHDWNAFADRKPMSRRVAVTVAFVSLVTLAIAPLARAQARPEAETRATFTAGASLGDGETALALSAGLEKAGTPATRVETRAACTIAKVGDGFWITTMRLNVRATVPGITPDAFRQAAEATKTGCPVSMALAGVPIELDAQLDGASARPGAERSSEVRA